jgi:importin subunit alpha-1
VTHNNREIQKEACWTLSNIAAGTVDQIQSVIDSGAIAPLVKLVSDKKTDQEVRSEACWVVLNATSCGSDSQIEVLVKEGCVSVLGVLLSEPSMVMMALEGLERVLQVEETRETSKIAEQYDNAGERQSN